MDFYENRLPNLENYVKTIEDERMKINFISKQNQQI